jgi:transposase
MGPALHLIARLYAVEERARTLSLSAEQRLALRQRLSARLLGKLHHYLLELQPEVLPKSPSGAAIRYALNQWEALTRFLEDGELEIDNGATERANRDIALGRGNWTFFGSDGAKLCRFLQTVRRRAVCLVPRRASPNRLPPHHQTRRADAR